MRPKRQYRIRALEDRPPRSRPEPDPRSLDEIALAEFAASRQELIARAAYERASRRAFRDGDALGDWLAAEREVDARLESRRGYRAAARRPSDARSQT